MEELSRHETVKVFWESPPSHFVLSVVHTHLSTGAQTEYLNVCRTGMLCLSVNRSCPFNKHLPLNIIMINLQQLVASFYNPTPSYVFLSWSSNHLNILFFFLAPLTLVLVSNFPNLPLFSVRSKMKFTQI